jgi:hypothetical protein
VLLYIDLIKLDRLRFAVIILASVVKILFYFSYRSCCPSVRLRKQAVMLFCAGSDSYQRCGPTSQRAKTETEIFHAAVHETTML